MTAHAPGRTERRQAARVATRLPWWAVTLPVVAFVVLLTLTGGGEAEAAEPPQYLVRLLEYLERLL
ncbi:hypothetical protein [Streptomyces megasporus]|uniref:hypothetical protein n=1 Tax=Streptomyces megasporus TaxID=44060 RepID=UPI0004E22231|nr:hypothetical protein [Streptomyces megasporus]